MISIIIPASNEAAQIERTLDHLLSLKSIQYKLMLMEAAAMPQRQCVTDE